jgi:hypothetical protein
MVYDLENMSWVRDPYADVEEGSMFVVAPSPLVNEWMHSRMIYEVLDPALSRLPDSSEGRLRMEPPVEGKSGESCSRVI